MEKTKTHSFSMEFAREIGWFRSYEALDVLQQRAQAGQTISDQEKQTALSVAMTTAEQMISGIDFNTASQLLQDWRTSPMSKKSCKEPAHWQAVEQALVNALNSSL